jgi:hypothetical protein
VIPCQTQKATAMKVLNRVITIKTFTDDEDLVLRSTIVSLSLRLGVSSVFHVGLPTQMTLIDGPMIAGPSTNIRRKTLQSSRSNRPRYKADERGHESGRQADVPSSDPSRYAYEVVAEPPVHDTNEHLPEAQHDMNLSRTPRHEPLAILFYHRNEPYFE